MPWFFVDDAFADSKPVMALDRSLRNEAIGLWVRCGAWSAKEETDGRVPLDIVRGFGGSPRVIRVLHEQADLWDVRAVFDENLTKIRPESGPNSDQNPREILFKNWQKWQKTKAENEAKRKADAERQAEHRRAKKGRNYVPRNDIPSDDSETSQRDAGPGHGQDSKPASQCDNENVSRRESQCPDPTRPDPTLSVETSSGGVTSVDARAPRPNCSRHETNSLTACGDCARRREWDKAHEADELKAKRDRKWVQENCARCHGVNTYEDENGRAIPCQPHQDPRKEAVNA